MSDDNWNAPASPSAPESVVEAETRQDDAEDVTEEPTPVSSNLAGLAASWRNGNEDWRETTDALVNGGDSE